MYRFLSCLLFVMCCFICFVCLDGLKTNTTISVLNVNTVGSPTGNFSKITGVAYTPDPSKPGQLKVDLDGVPVNGDCKLINISMVLLLLCYV